MRSQSKNEARLTGKVVLDAMGSDHAPHAEIDAALAATRDFGVGVILVGQPHKVEPELRRRGWRGDGDHGIKLIEEAVANAVRRKKKSSLRIGSKLVSEGAPTALSPRNTGAAMATAKMVIGTMPGADRPALAAMIPRKAAKSTLLLDVGANSECNRTTWPSSIMGDAYSRSVLGTAKPSVGLKEFSESRTSERIEKGIDAGCISSTTFIF